MEKMKRVDFEVGGHIEVPEEFCTVASVRGEHGTNVLVYGDTPELVAVVNLLVVSLFKKLTPPQRMAFLGTLRLALKREGVWPDDDFEIKLFYKGYEVPDDPKNAIEKILTKITDDLVDDLLKKLKKDR